MADMNGASDKPVVPLRHYTGDGQSEARLRAQARACKLVRDLALDMAKASTYVACTWPTIELAKQMDKDATDPGHSFARKVLDGKAFSESGTVSALQRMGVDVGNVDDADGTLESMLAAAFETELAIERASVAAISRSVGRWPTFTY